MAKRIKGKCKYCGKEYTMSYMKKHLDSCSKRQNRQTEMQSGKPCGYFELAIYPKYTRDYWLYIEIKETASLIDLDNFLRDIWLECCGHLSAFEINGLRYESIPEEDNFWGAPVETMDKKLKTVLEPGMIIEHEYDFGSTTELLIEVTGYRMGIEQKDNLTILSRNNPHEILCEECGEKPAVSLCAECMCEYGGGYVCEDCEKTHRCGDEMMLTVCNSPRMGVCGYCGSDIYPDQFVPDV